ncbi:Zn(2+)-responsive transcriptional regulator [Grimontia marina]|uniref:HTH-type transcriptional regulator ZntR n=1 Tax=Grimontia marina TaxID=646534 RepID=A0A128FAD2_9GAMM|nr:Zn(2+)-responsive transcriptional regulator [Grimontia marina]CZF83767.1 HTH-type transcriptional regulator ZntR [Grimontia marina]
MFRIGDLAARCNVSKDTIRFYEKKGLLDSPFRSESGYRLYTNQEERHLKFIIRAKSVGFTLREIQELLSIRLEPDDFTCAEVKSIADKKIQKLEARIREIESFKNSLTRLSDTCCGGSENASNCSILDRLES